MINPEIDRLDSLVQLVVENPREKQEILLEHDVVKSTLLDPVWRHKFEQITDRMETLAFLSVVAIRQHEVLFNHQMALEPLVEVEKLYTKLGGIIGYHLIALKLMCHENTPRAALSAYSLPPAFDVRIKSKAVMHATLQGIFAMEEMGEVYPVGGLGDRLNLKNLPTALLDFCGRSLFEGLIRDLEAREWLYYKLKKKRIVTPIALMTSREKDNHQLILQFLEEKNWFSRGKENFRLFSQISVPVITQEGQWSTRPDHSLNLQPGGHGALWCTAQESGVFAWFEERGRSKVLIRQINNPLGGIDHGLLALIGLGVTQKKAFGFASCQRVPHTAEGALTLQKKNGLQAIVNIEYTDFQRFGLELEQASYPTNTNILFADLKKIEARIRSTPLPGLILNMKSEVPYLRDDGSFSTMLGGRLESMMQNISDGLTANCEEDLPTFLTYNERLKTISVTKRSYEEGKSALETPVGAFSDLMHNAKELLQTCCGFKLDHCEEMIVLYHPALGPLYEVIGQKIKRGKIRARSELQLEITELLMEDLYLDGSLLIQGLEGRCELRRVRVVNQGMKSKECLEINLEGSAEFVADGIIFHGGHKIVVPDGQRWSAYNRADGTIAFHKKKISTPTWEWDYTVLEDEIIVSQNTFHTPASPSRSPQQSGQPQ